jgi:Mor family transcriptional regulator
MTKAPAKTTTPTAPTRSTTPRLDDLIGNDPDLVDRIFEYLLEEFPHIAGEKFAKAKVAVREEFKGQEIYIPARGATERQKLIREVLSLFNGRNASEVARRLNISRGSVYRYLKQSRSG